MAGEVWRFKVHQHTKFHWNHSNSFWDIMIFSIFKMTAIYHLGFLVHFLWNMQQITHYTNYTILISSDGVRSVVGNSVLCVIIIAWYGHVLRKEDNDWVRKCMEYEVEVTRPRGRPKKTWREIVEKDCRARGLNTEDAMDRNRWRKLIGMIDDHDECEWVNVSSGTGSPGLSQTNSTEP